MKTKFKTSFKDAFKASFNIGRKARLRDQGLFELVRIYLYLRSDSVLGGILGGLAVVLSTAFSFYFLAVIILLIPCGYIMRGWIIDAIIEEKESIKKCYKEETNPLMLCKLRIRFERVVATAHIFNIKE